ncbi:MFS transporter [Kushneria marisflavi]|uniref:MFS transporter n=1 Tax=Kushneria marisflavi TaxID=157779 RepID=A0A240UL83_9GAMM|nr:MFS transporter [Kushneria marisflavi]ART62267.1 MFS transporter [Kushneria marisflavi]RKD87364.1 putative MFS family arabinose efflux permease [Kushneria marisflavi]
MSRQLFSMALAPLLGLFIFGIGNGFLMSLVTVRLDAAGESATTIGWISAAFHAGLVIGALFSDRILLRIGHIRAYACFGALVAVTVLAQGLWVNAEFWFVMRFLCGWATLGVYLVIESWLLSASDPKVRGRLLALYMIALYGAGVIGQLLLGVADIGDDSAAFMVIAILAALSILPLGLIPRVSPLIEHAEPLSPWRLITVTPTGVAGCFVAGLLISAVYSLLPLYLQRSGLELSDVGRMMAVVILGAMLLQYPIGRWSDRHDRQMVLILTSLALSALCFGLLWIGDGPLLMAGMLFLIGGSVFVLYPVSISHASDRAPAGALVRMSQGLLLINELGATFSPPLITPVMSRLGNGGLFMTMGGLGLVLAVFLLWRRSQRPAPMPVAPFTSNPPQSVVGAELVVTEALVLGAIDHEHHEDLSQVVPDVDTAHPDPITPDDTTVQTRPV